MSELGLTYLNFKVAHKYQKMKIDFINKTINIYFLCTNIENSNKYVINLLSMKIKYISIIFCKMIIDGKTEKRTVSIYI